MWLHVIGRYVSQSDPITFRVLNQSYAVLGLEFNANSAFMGKLTQNIDPPPSDGEFYN